MGEEWPEDEKIMVFKLSEVREIASLLRGAGVEVEKVRGVIQTRYYKDKNLEKLFFVICDTVGQAIAKTLETIKRRRVKGMPKFMPGELKEDNGLLMLLTALFFSDTYRKENHNDFSEGSTEKR